jgi:hypothetical protein
MFGWIAPSCYFNINHYCQQFKENIITCKGHHHHVVSPMPIVGSVMLNLHLPFCPFFWFSDYMSPSIEEDYSEESVCLFLISAELLINVQ